MCIRDSSHACMLDPFRETRSPPGEGQWRRSYARAARRSEAATPYNLRVRILIANDDGYLAPGLAALVKACEGLGDLDVVAPEQNASGTSNSLTLNRGLSVYSAANGYRYINGTPSDCVHLALSGLLEHRPDLVVAGINQGANMGDDTLYSGTVAAAMEGFLFGIPAIAFSQVQKGWDELDAAARVARSVIEHVLRDPPAPSHYLLNVNIPNRADADTQPRCITRLGRRHASEPVIRQVLSLIHISEPTRLLSISYAV